MSTLPGRVTTRMKELGNPEIAAHSQRFFRTGKGEYGDLTLEQILEVLHSPWHEVRLLAVLLLVEHYAVARGAREQTAVYRAYLDHVRYVNNWDLVD